MVDELPLRNVFGHGDLFRFHREINHTGDCKKAFWAQRGAPISALVRSPGAE